MSLSNSQRLSLVALILGGVVFLGTLARLNGYDAPRTGTQGAYMSDRLDCIGKAEYEDCFDRVERQHRAGIYTPWYYQHPALASLLAAGVTFFVIAGGGRLFRE